MRSWRRESGSGEGARVIRRSRSTTQSVSRFRKRILTSLTRRGERQEPNAGDAPCAPSPHLPRSYCTLEMFSSSRLLLRQRPRFASLGPRASSFSTPPRLSTGVGRQVVFGVGVAGLSLGAAAYYTNKDTLDRQADAGYFSWRRLASSSTGGLQPSLAKQRWDEVYSRVSAWLQVAGQDNRLAIILAQNWLEMSEAKKTAAGLIGVFAGVWLAWRLPRRLGLGKWLAHDALSGKSVTMLTSIFSHRVRREPLALCQRCGANLLVTAPADYTPSRVQFYRPLLLHDRRLWHLQLLRTHVRHLPAAVNVSLRIFRLLCDDRPHLVSRFARLVRSSRRRSTPGARRPLVASPSTGPSLPRRVRRSLRHRLPLSTLIPQYLGVAHLPSLLPHSDRLRHLRPPPRRPRRPDPRVGLP